jgi:AraC-like DNA-binding protein
MIARPVSAASDPLLVFSLRDPIAAFEYATGYARVLPSALVVGSQTRRVADLQIAGHYAAFSINFQPAGIYRLFGVPGSELVDRAEDAAVVLDPGFGSLLQQLREFTDVASMVKATEAFLLGRLHGARSAHPVQRAALALRRSNGAINLADLVQTTGHTMRHFDRTFLSQLGMTPKRYARISRFAFAWRLKFERPGLTWTDVSHEAGYFDQNHLVKDFKSLVGEVPSAYLRVMAATPEPLRPSHHSP